jgi:acetyl-CoA synthetase
MSYPYQIKNLDDYHEAYKKSIAEPEKFWGEIAEHFTWRKKWALNWEQVLYCSDACKKKKFTP